MADLTDPVPVPLSVVGLVGATFVWIFAAVVIAYVREAQKECPSSSPAARATFINIGMGLVLGLGVLASLFFGFQLVRRLL